MKATGSWMSQSSTLSCHVIHGPSHASYRNQAIAVAALILVPAVADACMVCNSNLSYNGVPFTAVWVLILIGWTASLGGALWYRKRHSFDPLPVQNYFRPARTYLLVVLVLYVLGMHLVAILFLPWLLFKAAFSRSAVALQPMQNAAKALLILLIVSIPVFYMTVPRTTSEVGVRVNAARVKQNLQQMVSFADTEIQAQEMEDPFAYQTFDIPVFGWVVQSPGFYRPLITSNILQFWTDGNNRAAWSRGPDGDFDLTSDFMTVASKHLLKGGAPMLIPFSYNPTNGIFSNGDIVKFAEKPVARPRKL